MTCFWRGLFAGIGMVCVLVGTAAFSGEIRRLGAICGDKVCPWFQAVVDPPEGWMVSDEIGQANQITVLLPKGEPDPAKPFIYVRTSYDSNNQPLQAFIAVEQKQWRQDVPDSIIEPLNSFAREGKPAFLIYLYKNPSRPRQAFELVAFTKDVDPTRKDQRFFFQVVLAAPSMWVLEASKAAFYLVLRRV
jgi:hypothetical protein